MDSKVCSQGPEADFLVWLQKLTSFDPRHLLFSQLFFPRKKKSNLEGEKMLLA